MKKIVKKLAEKKKKQTGKNDVFALLNSLPHGILVFDDQENIIETNKAMMEIIPTKKKTMKDLYPLLEKTLKEYPMQREKVQLEKAVHKIIKKQEQTHFFSVPIGDHYFDIQVLPIKSEKKGVILFLDVSRLKENNDFKSEFLSMVFHQLKTPLAGVQWTLDMLMSGELGEMEPEQKEYLEELKVRNKRMKKLVNQLLNVSHVESDHLVSKPEDFDVSELIEEGIEDVSTLAKEKGVMVIYAKTIQKSKVFLDRNLVYQVFHNLLTNAIRYSPIEKGASVNITLTQDTETFTLSLKDEGIGIPKKSKDDIFKKFFRADNALKKETDGSGFGLYIVKKIVEFCGGKIWFESQEGKGTTFHVQFPLQTHIK